MKRTLFRCSFPYIAYTRKSDSTPTHLKNIFSGSKKQKMKYLKNDLSQGLGRILFADFTIQSVRISGFAMALHRG